MANATLGNSLFAGAIHQIFVSIESIVKTSSGQTNIHIITLITLGCIATQTAIIMWTLYVAVVLLGGGVPLRDGVFST